MTPLHWRVIAASVARIVIVMAVLVAAYLVVPVEPETSAVSAVTWAGLLALITVVVAFMHQARRINRSRYPLLAGAESLIILLAIFLIGFAFVYFVMSTSAPDAFSEPLNRTGAMYFAITVLSTVGFGDITPKADPARWLVSAQMLIDIGLIAGALRLIFGIARRAEERRRESGPALAD